MRSTAPTLSSTPTGLVANAAASGVATALFRPAAMPTRLRRSLHAGLGVAAGAASVWALGRPSPPLPGSVAADQLPPEAPVPVPARLAIAAGLGSLVALSSAAGMGLDAAAERALVRRGVRRPRWWIGAAAAGLTAAMSWAESRADSRVVPPR